MKVHNTNEHIKQAYLFEDFIYRLFSKMEINEISQNVMLKDKTSNKSMECDLLITHDKKSYIAEIKYYYNDQSLRSKLYEVSKKLVQKNVEEISLLIICANNISDDIKSVIKEEYSIEVIDIRNLLWITQNNELLRSELVSFINYSVHSIEPQEMILPFIKKLLDNSVAKEYINKLNSIQSGRKYFNEYEKICTEILQYVFSEDLTLWQEQKKSNNNLYRFDLCCKIKFGEVGEFFDTIRQYFNTKYIVFEFKNYKDKITQSEVYTTEKYLYTTALRNVAIIISRSGDSLNAETARKGCLRENGKLILCLSDEDMINLINIKYENDEQTPAGYLTNILDDMLLTLEK